MISVLLLFCQLFLPRSSQGCGQRGGKGIAVRHLALWQLLSFCEQIGAHCRANWCPVGNGTGFCGFTLALLSKFQSLCHWCAWMLCFPVWLHGCKSFSGQILLRRREWWNDFLFFLLFSLFQGCGGCGQCSSSLALAQAAPAPARAVCWPRSDLTLFLLGKSWTYCVRKWVLRKILMWEKNLNGTFFF